MKTKATSFDIAHYAGVSQSTVSRALRDSPLVNKETRDKVKAIALEMNYKVDKNASNLRQQQSKTLALLLFQDPTSDDSLINPFFLSMLGSITRASSLAGYDLLVSFQDMSGDWHADYEDTNKADGIILLGYGDYMVYRDKLKVLTEQQTHFVRWGAQDAEYPGVSIGSDNFQGCYDATEHLIKLGRKRIAFIGDATISAPEMYARFQGFTQALTDHGLHPASQVEAINTEESGYEAAKQLIDANNIPDGFICASDLIAIGVIRALNEKGLIVPDNVSVVGYDNITAAGMMLPALTTVQQNTKLAGEVLVSSLLSQINGREFDTTLLPTSLIVRQSCGANQSS